jgi:hypothetical protein
VVRAALETGPGSRWEPEFCAAELRSLKQVSGYRIIVSSSFRRSTDPCRREIPPTVLQFAAKGIQKKNKPSVPCLGIPLAITVWRGDNHIVSKTRALGHGLDRVRIGPRRSSLLSSRESGR